MKGTKSQVERAHYSYHEQEIRRLQEIPGTDDLILAYLKLKRLQCSHFHYEYKDRNSPYYYQRLQQQGRVVGVGVKRTNWQTMTEEEEEQLRQEMRRFSDKYGINANNSSDYSVLEERLITLRRKREEQQENERKRIEEQQLKEPEEKIEKEAIQSNQLNQSNTNIIA